LQTAFQIHDFYAVPSRAGEEKMVELRLLYKQSKVELHPKL